MMEREPLVVDVAPVQPEARQAVFAAASVFIEHTHPWFMGLLVHGSALKGGAIPDCSDIDLQLYLKQDAFTRDWRLPLELSMAIHGDLARIDPAPFQYIQCHALPEEPSLPGQVGRRQSIGPVPGTYHVVAGRRPVPEATADEVRQRAHETVRDLAADPAGVADGLLQHGGGRLERLVRLLCTDVWPALFSVLACRADDPCTVWRLTKGEVVARVAVELPPLGREGAHFLALVRAYFDGGRSGPAEAALTVLRQGLRVIALVKEWYEDSDQRPRAAPQTT